jgi:hypothetical protein
MNYRLIFSLGKAEAKIVGYKLPDICQIIKLGILKYTQLIKDGTISRQWDKSTGVYRLIEEVPDHLKTPELDRVLLTSPVRVTKNKKGYFIPHIRATDAQQIYRYKPIVKSSYLFSQAKQDDKFGDMLIRQNKIKMLFWKDVLSFQRKPKEGSVIDDNFVEETKLFVTTVSNNESCYLAHEYDYRGRVYANAIITYQGDEWCKAAISPCLGKNELTWRGLNELKYYLASHFGLDKIAYRDRIQAVNNGLCSDITKAKEPILATKTLQMLQRAKIGRPFDGTVNIDATNSGFQILAIATGDAELAKWTNLTDSSKAYDYYAFAASKITNDMDEIRTIRPYLKKALMGVAYNSEALPREMGVKIAEILGKTKMFCLSKEWRNAITISKPVAELQSKLNGIICRLGQKASLQSDKDKFIIRWTMPDGFKVEMPLKKTKSISMLTEAFRGNFMFNALGWDKQKNYRGLVPNIIHSIDGYVCRQVIRNAAAKGIKVLSIHDCFIVHPSYASVVKRLYTIELKKLNRMNIIDYIIKQIDPSESYTKCGSFKMVNSATSYALC